MAQDILDDLDLDTLEIDTTSCISNDLSEYFSDLVWQCRFKESPQYAKIALLYEHKSYKPAHPHFQLLDYIRGSWRIQMGEKKDPTLMIPIVLYHGAAAWEVESFDSYFGEIKPKSLRFLPCFDFILVNLQKYSDETIRAFKPIFLKKALLALKHHLDKEYLRLHIVELLVGGYELEKDEQTRIFMFMFGKYLTVISGMSKQEIVEEVNKSDNNLKTKAMSIFEEFEKEGIEKGIEKEKRETIIRFWANGISVTLIANITQLSVVEVEKVIKSIHK